MVKEMNINMDEMRKYQFSATTQFVYEYLKLRPEATNGEIAETIRVSKKTVYRSRQKLEQEGLVEIKERKSSEFTYLILDTSNNSLKIGEANNVSKRLSELQVGNPSKLVLLKVLNGDVYPEGELHDRFAKYKVRGEWFRYEGELRTFVENLVRYD